MSKEQEETAKPHFETVKSFADVPVTENGVSTLDFLEASEGMATILGLLGSAPGIFYFLQTDLQTNIKGVRQTYNASPDECVTLPALINWQKSGGHAGSGENKLDGIGSLRRLSRGLLLTCRAMQSSRANTTEEPNVSFRHAYEQVLRPRLGFAGRMVVTVALKTVPSRKEFYARIAQGGSEDRLLDRLDEWLAGLDTNLNYVCKLYEEGGHGSI